MRIARRFLMICALGLWLGGLTFYTLVALRASHQIVRDHTKVGFVTQKATAKLNAIGTAALALMLWNGAASWKSARPWMRGGLAASWIVAAWTHVWVLVLHARLDGMLDFQARRVQEGSPFHAPHELYQLVTGFEWGAGLVYLLVALMAWRQEDAATSASPASAP
jgi:hypothetical protein